MWELGNEQCHPVVQLQLCCPDGGLKVAVPVGPEVAELHVENGTGSNAVSYRVGWNHY